MDVVSEESSLDSKPGSAYQPLAGIRDEAKSPKGAIRTGWTEVFEEIDEFGEAGLQKWRSDVARISRKRGLAYHPVAVEEIKTKGTWSLDPIPWNFPPETWKKIEEGVGQRNRLFEAILKDIYGPQHLISEKLVPAEIIFGHRGFLPDLYDVTPGDAIAGLGISAFDIAVVNSGRLFALNDRFDSPFGLGVALENRTVVNAVLPELFRNCHVRRLGYFFRDWFDHLAASAPGNREAPRIVILDSRPVTQDTEISFLANYCRITRVSDADLTVRNGKVHLKALTGLEPVDLIWKFAAGRDLDPLESNHPIDGGVPGIFSAIREKNVAVVSHPGCEVLQSPGLYPFLPKICERLLSEPLLIPPVATWWCGNPSAKNYVLENLNHMVIKSVGHHSDFQTLYGRNLSFDELSWLTARIEARPQQYIGQEELNLSTVPVATDQGLRPRGAVMRTFSFVGKDGKPNVMPGGLARVSKEDGGIVSTRKAGESKDVWVRSHSPEKPISIARELTQSCLTTPQITPSKMAENLYWTGRYAERTDFITRFAARLLDGRTFGFSHDPEIESRHEALLLYSICEMNQCLSWLDNAPNPDAKIHLLLNEPKCPVSIAFNLKQFRGAAQSVWEKWSRASILAIESIWNSWDKGTGDLFHLNDYPSQLDETQLQLSAFFGLNLDTMTRDDAWALLEAGRRIERTVNIVGILSFLLKQEVEPVLEHLLDESILFISDSLGTYQSKFMNEPLTGPIMQLLLGDAGYPRSVKFQLNRLGEVLAKLPDPKEYDHPSTFLKPIISKLDRIVLKTKHDGEMLPITRTVSAKDLQSLYKEIFHLSDHITQSYFSHAVRITEP
ncbi:MAG: circularly permuted type 2 ATP-grasp protein [Verrucomicrobiales bacterium]|nr:circularly permuted type 2 ATP-grasp protein [Verrucomicrobiales bacterium]